MDREKLNKKAEEQANYSTHWSWGDRKDCFISGADWLMQQPLSERLTEEEKEKIRNYHRVLTKDKHIAIYQRSYSGQAATDALLFSLEQIFGKDLFNDK